MNKVILRPVALLDLNVRIARPMGDNKIRHYVVPCSYSIVTGIKPLDAVKDFIVAEEGPTEFVLEESIEPKRDSPIVMVDVSEVLLQDDPQIRKSLGKNVPFLVMQWNQITSQKDRLLNPFKNFLNFFIFKINGVHAKYQLKKIKEEGTFEAFVTMEDENDESLGVFNSRKEAQAAIDQHRNFWGDAIFIREHVDYRIKYTMSDSLAYRFDYLNIYQNPLIQPFNPIPHYVRRCTGCSYLAISFEEGQEELAARTILEDLRILDKNKLIMAHLALPSTILLADVVGSGKKYYSMFCFLFVDPDKLAKLINKAPVEMTGLQLSLIGVKNETPESGTGNKIYTEYDIEEVLVSSSGYAHREYVQSYLDSVDEINEIASGMAEAIKYVEDNKE